MPFRFDFASRTVAAGLMSLLAALTISTALPGAAIAQDTPAPAETPAPADPAAPVAPPAPQPTDVVATVGGEPITEADMAFAAEDAGQELAQVPVDQRRPFLLGVLIEMKLMAQAAREQGLDEGDVFQQRVEYLEERALRRAYFGEAIIAGVTPETVQAAYDAYAAAFVPADEIRASHILVSEEADAIAIKAELEGGADFATLAREKSIDPSAASNGGDLGFFTSGAMVEPFNTQAFALTEPGQLSDPVQTQFGWHVIRLDERRQTQPRTLEEMGAELQQQVLFESYDRVVTELRTASEIVIPDPALAAAVEAQTAAAP